MPPPPHLPSGFGLGLRPPHYPDILGGSPRIDWFEAISENYMEPGGAPLANLIEVGERFPLVLHGVSLSVGGSDPLDMDYLRRLKALADIVEPAWISDHLCWSRHRGHSSHDLLPLPYTLETVRRLAERIRRVQEFLGRRILMENVSSYLTFRASEMTEWEFLTEVAKAADCLVLLDVNNIYVNAVNHGFDPLDFLDGVPAERVTQIHLAGHRNQGTCIIDTHDAPIVDPVWNLYGEAIRRLGPVPTMIERDDRIPPLAELERELDRARAVAGAALGEEAAA
jgi:uncharacterized protein (UPF0276 family)